MVTTLAFLEPEYSYYLLGILPLSLLLVYCLRRKLAKLALFQASSQFVSSLSFNKFIPALLVVAVLLTSLTRPISGYEDVTIPGTRSDLLLVVDISDSMRADDVKPSRLTLAKRKIFDTIDLLESNRQGVRLGIILFAGSAYVYCPLTEDYSVVKVFAESVNTSLISSGGSDLLGALRLALNTFRVVNAKDPRIIVLSDGEKSSEEHTEVFEMLERFSVPVDSIGFGTPEGAPIKLASGRFLRGRDGNLIVSKLKEEALQSLAETTGGTYQLASAFPADITTIVEQIQTETSANKKGEDTIRLYREIGPFFVFAAFTLLCFFLFFRFPSLVFSLLLVSLPIHKAEAEAISILPTETAQKAWHAYRNGDFEAASTLYRDALLDEPDNRSLQAGLAASLYRTNNFKEAALLYQELEDTAESGREMFESTYNRGNAHLQSGDSDRAIAAYEKALRIKPGDKRVEDNLALAKLLKEKQQSNPDEQQKQDSKSQTQEEEEQKDEEHKKDRRSKDPEKDKNKSTDKEDAEDTKSDESDEKEAARDEKHGESGRRDDPSEKKNPEEGTADPDQEKDNTSETTPGESPESFDLSERTKNPRQANPDNQMSDDLTKHSKEALEKSEAAKWLDSLPDTPVLLRQKGGSKNTRGQTW